MTRAVDAILFSGLASVVGRMVGEGSAWNAFSGPFCLFVDRQPAICRHSQCVSKLPVSGRSLATTFEAIQRGPLVPRSVPLVTIAL